MVGTLRSTRSGIIDMPRYTATRSLLLLCALLGCAMVRAKGLDSTEQRIVRAADERQAQSLELLAEVVNIPSATENHAGVRKVGDVFARELAVLGFETRWVGQRAEVGRSGHLVAVHRGTRGKRLLLIGHLDTVLEGEPFRRDGNRAYGTGIADMKGGNLVALEALHALAAVGALDACTVTVVFTGDEEDTGRPYEVSRAVLFEAAAASDVVLAFEGHEPGAAVVGRRGFSAWRLRVTGEQGHSSNIFGDTLGSGAVFEAARILSAFHAHLREPGVTFNPSVIVGGTDVALDAGTATGHATGKTNVVAREVVVDGDLRFLTRDQLERTRARMRAIVESGPLPRTAATLTFSDGMPAMEPTAANLALLRAYDACSRDLGHGPVTAHDPARRGAGDIAFVSGRLPALDGLGAVGTGEHAPGEHIALEALPVQVERAALLMYRLVTGAVDLAS